MTLVPRSMPMLSRRSKAAAVASVALLAAFSSPCAFATPKSLKETGRVCSDCLEDHLRTFSYIVNNQGKYSKSPRTWGVVGSLPSWPYMGVSQKWEYPKMDGL